MKDHCLWIRIRGKTEKLLITLSLKLDEDLHPSFYGGKFSMPHKMCCVRFHCGHLQVKALLASGTRFALRWKQERVLPGEYSHCLDPFLSIQKNALKFVLVWILEILVLKGITDLFHRGLLIGKHQTTPPHTNDARELWQGGCFHLLNAVISL